LSDSSGVVQLATSAGKVAVRITPGGWAFADRDAMELASSLPRTERVELVHTIMEEFNDARRGARRWGGS
jgi:hypothetical protein